LRRAHWYPVLDVIPAKAGIHADVAKSQWIRAFAGMTAVIQTFRRASRRGGACMPRVCWRSSIVVGHVDDDETGDACRQLGFELIVDALLQHRAGKRRIDADPALPGIGFVRADDAIVRDRAGGDVLHLDTGSEEHRVRVRGHSIDYAQRFQPLAQVAHPPVDLAQLLLAVGVFGVLGAIAFGGSGGQRLHHLGAPDPPQLVEFGLQPRVTPGGDQRGALFCGRPPASHRVRSAYLILMLPRMLRTMRLVTVRAACLPAACPTPWRRLVPNRNSLTICPKPPSSASASCLAAGAFACAGMASARLASSSAADSRLIAVSYLPLTGLPARTWARSDSVIAPIRQRGGDTRVCSTGIGMPLSCSVDTSASPVPSFDSVAATSRPGLDTKVSAAVFTAFWSRGVKARSACCTRLPSWPRMSVGTSSGNCEQKYTPTPLERMIRTTCSMRWRSAGGASSNSRCASSKMKTSLGRSRSPTSGSVSNS